MLARLTAERKIETKAKGKKLTMRRLVPIDRFSGYEREFVEALFFAGEETDTDRDQGALSKPRLRSRLEDQEGTGEASSNGSRISGQFAQRAMAGFPRPFFCWPERECSYCSS